MLDVDKECEDHLILEGGLRAELVHTELVVVLCDRYEIYIYGLNFVVTKLLCVIKGENGALVLLLQGHKMLGKSIEASIILLVKNYPSFEYFFAFNLEFAEELKGCALTRCAFKLKGTVLAIVILDWPIRN